LEDRDLDGELLSDSRGDLGGRFRPATEMVMTTSRTRDMALKGGHIDLAPSRP
jgi:hypothetical protein